MKRKKNKIQNLFDYLSDDQFLGDYFKHYVCSGFERLPLAERLLTFLVDLEKRRPEDLGLKKACGALRMALEMTHGAMESLNAQIAFNAIFGDDEVPEPESWFSDEERTSFTACLASARAGLEGEIPDAVWRGGGEKGGAR